MLTSTSPDICPSPEKLSQDVDKSHLSDSTSTFLSHLFALPQFMAQHNCKDLHPTDTLSTVPTCIQATSNLTQNPICAHNPMATQCNQSQYFTLFNKICAHNLSASHDNQANLSNSLTSPCPPDPWEYVLKKSAADLREQDFPVKWFKFIYTSSKPRMTETSTCTPVHVAHSPLAFLNHLWTINLHDGYLSLHALMPVEYIPPSIPTLCHLLSTMFHFGVDFLHSTQDTKQDVSSLASPKGEITSSFSWTNFLESHIMHFMFW